MWGLSIMDYEIKNIRVEKASYYSKILTVRVELKNVKHVSLKGSKEYSLDLEVRTDNWGLLGATVGSSSNHGGKAEFIINRFKKKSFWARKIIEDRLSKQILSTKETSKAMEMLQKYR